MSFDPHTKLGLLHQPDSLRNDDLNTWSQGRGPAVWAKLCACIAGDLPAIRKLVEQDCSYAYLHPPRFTVRENHRSVVDYLLEHGAKTGDGQELIAVARERDHQELAVFLKHRPINTILLLNWMKTLQQPPGISTRMR